jgi:glycosyltransferase involved in cell wall biosynthesis
MPQDMRKGINFVIPARNEESNIKITLKKLKSLVLPEEYKVIVVDHASKDETAKAAELEGATVADLKIGTIGYARNYGVTFAEFDMIVFIDADISLTEEWARNIPSAIEAIRSSYKLVTGSHCSAPEDGSIIERYWFDNFSKDEKTTHLGTGHLIVSRAFFTEIGGFDETLVTGEDYEFCMRVKENGGAIVNNAALKVIHRDYPKTFGDFVAREAWHGKGDCQSFKAFVGSKVAVMAAVFLVAHLLLLFAVCVASVELALLSVLVIFGILVVSAVYKFRKAPPFAILVNIFIFYAYYVGRAGSLLQRLF